MIKQGVSVSSMVDRLVKLRPLPLRRSEPCVSVSSMVDRLVKLYVPRIFPTLPQCFSVLNGGPFGETMSIPTASAIVGGFQCPQWWTVW